MRLAGTELQFEMSLQPSGAMIQFLLPSNTWIRTTAALSVINQPYFSLKVTSSNVHRFYLRFCGPFLRAFPIIFPSLA